MINKNQVNVFLVDDHQIVRNGIRALLSDNENINIIGEAANGKEAITSMQENASKIKVVIMDISMPEMDGVETTRYLKKHFPKLNVLALSIHDDEPYIVSMLEAGALGYILKTTEKKELIQAVCSVAKGKSYFDKESSVKLAHHFTSKNNTKENSKSTSFIHLTKREKEVLTLIAAEFTNTEIAKKLFLSPRTVDSHRRNLLQKLNAKNTAGLVKYALTHTL
ncbi:response regulator transcription factor [Marivirga arenosa]|uniref:Response regulator transcription factor n=1 Tax=Marivirga arenosa TaxID=3059076 RepID=A0AA49GM44_9BACT|nr:response regulator transcription factor [Marivirga sp. ABR2-2]WKK87837.2 response regulator transcription factor [Marivirga sp. ABR2-2]